MVSAPDPKLRFERITDAEDPRVSAFRDIRDRDLAGRNGFIAEGAVVLDQLLLSIRYRPTSLLILENRLAGLTQRLAKIPPGTPIYVASRGVIDQIAGFPIHRGVMAHGELEASTATPEDFLKQAKARGGPIVVCVGISNHDNLGSIFRNAAAFDAAGIILDETSCDPLYRKAIRVSVGTILTVPWMRFPRVRELPDRLRDVGFSPVALTPSAHRTIANLPQGEVALFLGAEGPGLPDEIINRIEPFRISMVPELDSLNVATAAAIALHALYSAA